ncbi:sulfotransferase domain-containing protein [uncultured Paraglaciecola sp.]|uniref:sulfotransferase domain-containing protein n=1 Tax=uncultured Paraglaciecola sp. TaxID=1765024 RepID=UPI00259A5BDC|nr:sulfotransferase domain-containing protein [uncultured Paraglaciecola sp.]
MKKVDFLIVGAQKGGTTMLHSILTQHPQISMSQEKELHYFDNESRYTSDTNFQNYHQNFNFTKNKIVGESTPSYMYSNECAARIFRYNRNIKLIFILRNPIERAYSHWNMNKELGWVNGTFEDVFEVERNGHHQTRPLQNKRHSYIDRGMYSEQIRRFKRIFEQSNILILTSDELKQDRLATINKTCQFLNVSENHSMDESLLKAHSRNYNDVLTNKMRLKLQKLYRHEIRQLNNEFGINTLSWLENFKSN